MNKLDHHAKLTIHGLENMKSVTYRRLVDWLEERVKELKDKNADGGFAKVVTFKLMK